MEKLQSTVRDVHWETQSCPVGYLIQGIQIILYLYYIKFFYRFVLKSRQVLKNTKFVVNEISYSLIIVRVY